MNMCALPFQSLDLRALASGALWWPQADLLVVADLHLSKTDRMARRGRGLLPPYETRETLARLDAALSATGARHVVSLGDSFDDDLGAGALSSEDAAQLAALQHGRRWTWITGNHDPAPVGIAGDVVDSLTLSPLIFRHIAEARTAPGEVSGHFHPKHTLATRAGRITRPAFLFDQSRLILPAFGAYTGGLSTRDPALCDLLAPDARAVLTGPTPICVRAFPDVAA